MKIIKRILAPKEVRTVLSVLDELSLEFNSDAFQTIRRQIEDAMLRDSKKVVNQVKEGASPKELVYYAIANFAGDYIESGEYHVYRGILNPTGEDFLRIFDRAVDKLVKIGSVNIEDGKEQKAGIRKNIRSVG